MFKFKLTNFVLKKYQYLSLINIRTCVVILFMNMGALVFIGCATQPANYRPGEAIYHVESKLLIQDKVKDDSNSLFSDIYYVKNGPIRIEVNAAFGISVGSLVMTPKNIQILMPTKRTMIVGPFTPQTLKQVFKEEIDPAFLWSLILDKPLQAKNINCIEDKQIKSCNGYDNHQNPVALKIELVGQSQSMPLKKMTLETNSTKIVWLYKSISVHDKSYNETFVLKKPEDFKLLTIK